MNCSELINLSIHVLKDWKVIFIAFFSISFMMIGSYVVKYKKKPPRPKKIKQVKTETAPKVEPKKEDEEE